MGIRGAVTARGRETDPAEAWELPYSESEGGSYFLARRGSYPFTPRRADEIPVGAMESLAEACGFEGLHQVFIIPWAVRSTGSQGPKVISPNSVLALGARASALWTEKPEPGIKVIIRKEEYAAMEDVTILLYGRLSLISATQRLRIRYNTVARGGLEQALRELRKRLTGPAQPVPAESPRAAALPFKWDLLLHSPRVRLDEDAPVAFRFASVPAKERRAAPRGQLLVLNPYELVYLCDPAGPSNQYGEDSFIAPRSLVTGVRFQEGGLEVSGKGAGFSLPMAPALCEAAVQWFA